MSSHLTDRDPAGPVRLSPLPRPHAWHRPLLGLAALMAALAMAVAVMAVVDPGEVLGQNAWFKPLKFALSIGIYALCLAWMIGMLKRFRRGAHILGHITVVAMLVEIVIIVGAAAAGTTSHFNVATALNTTLWALMAVSIVIVWVIALIIGVALAMTELGDAGRNVAVRSGVVLALIGMGLAFLMTSPSPEQIENFRGVAGAHAVGVPDGGAGIPFLGWSTEGGDLRVPHFLGMHALQAVPLLLLGLEALSLRVKALRPARVRARLMVIAALTYAALLAVVTGQALRGESVVAPGALTVAAVALILFGAAVAATSVLVRERFSHPARRGTPTGYTA